MVGNRYRKTNGDCWLCLPASKYTNRILVSIENVIEEIQGRSIILLGDLNVNSIDRSDSQYKHFSSLCLSLQLQEIVQRPTRVTEKSAKCIDIILTNTSYLMNPMVTHVDFTDDCLVASSLQCVDREFSANNTRTHCRRRWPTNISDSRLSDALPKQMNLFGTMNGLDNMWSDWKDKFTQALDEVAPKVTTVHRRRQRCPWMTPRLLNLIHKQKSLCRKVLKSNKQDQVAIKNHRHLRNLTSNMYRCLKNEYFQNRIYQYQNSPKQFWSAINYISGRQDQRLPPSVIFRCRHGTTPPDLRKKLRSVDHGRTTRGASGNYVPYRSSSTSGTVSFSNRAPLIWNSLPNELQEAGSVNCFKRLYLKLLSDPHSANALDLAINCPHY